MRNEIIIPIGDEYFQADIGNIVVKLNTSSGHTVVKGADSVKGLDPKTLTEKTPTVAVIDGDIKGLDTASTDLNAMFSGIRIVHMSNSTVMPDDKGRVTRIDRRSKATDLLYTITNLP